MGTVISMGGRRILLPDEFEARRAELAQMLEVARGRLAQAQAEEADAEAMVQRIEGGLIEQDRWIDLMTRSEDEAGSDEPVPDDSAGEGQPDPDRR